MSTAIINQMSNITIKSILSEMKNTVETGKIVSPLKWLDWATLLNALKQDLVDEKTKYEMLYKQEQVDLIEEGKKISEADRIVEGRSDNYKMYSYLKGREKIVDDMIMLSKKRATIEN